MRAITQLFDGLKQRKAASRGSRPLPKTLQSPNGRKNTSQGEIIGSLRTKFLLAFILMIGLTGLLSVVTWISQSQAQAKVNKILDRELRLTKLSLEIGNVLRVVQGLQKDYLLEYKTLGFDKARATYLANFEDAVGKIQQKADDINEITNNPRNIKAANDIKHTISKYEETFQDMVTLLQNRAGFKGLLRSHIYYIDDDLRSQQMSPLKVQLLRVQQHEKEYLLQGDIVSAKVVNTLLDTFKSQVQNTRLPASQKFSLIVKAEAYRGAFNHLVKAENAVQARQEAFKANVRDVELLVERMGKESQEREALAKGELEVIGHRTQLIGIVGAVVLLAAGVLLALLFTNNLTKPLRHLKEVLERIAGGDYTVRAQVRGRDEVGAMTTSLNTMLDKVLALIQSQEERDALQTSIMKLLEEVSDVAEGDLTVEAEVTENMTGAIADSFNYMLHQLRRIVTNVQDATLLVSESANQIQATAEHLVDGSMFQAAQIVDSSAALDEMAVSIQQVSENAALSAMVADQALVNAKQGTLAVQNTMQAMQRMRNQVQSMVSRIQSLGERSQEIDDIVTLIGDIADRTSVLALNASIEAALAGEEGQGFAVVAREVERLAERSVDATQQIRDLVNAIQTETHVVITAIAESAQEVVESSKIADQAEQALGEIESVSTRLAELIQAISMAAEQQARGSQSLSKAMNDISDVTQQTAIGVKDATASISKLASLADELRDSVSTFKLPAMRSARGRHS